MSGGRMTNREAAEHLRKWILTGCPGASYEIKEAALTMLMAHEREETRATANDRVRAR